jgi:MFS family permease
LRRHRDPATVTDDGSRRHVLALGAFFALMYAVQSLGDPSSGIVAQPLRSLLREWPLDAGEIALFMALVGLPWALKPVFGLLSDFVPLAGTRRRHYLLLATGSACIGFAVLAGAPLFADDRAWLLAILLMPAIGVAFGDVLIDGLMVEEGQPTGLTGVLQSVQWTASYAAMLATGLIGAWFSEIGRPDLAFGTCAALWGVSLAFAAVVVREPVRVRRPGFAVFRTTLQEVRRSAGLAPVAAILFVWSFNPLWSTVIYLHLTEALGYTETEFGRFLALFSFGAMLGAAAYPLYCRRVAPGTLVHASIVAGVTGNLLYLALPDVGGLGALATATALLAGGSYMTGTMVQLDIAARRAPLAAAATIFALLMALTNLSASVSEALGGWLYAGAGPSPNDGWVTVVVLSALFPALCWAFMPSLRRALPEWFANAADPTDARR